jgi:Fe-S-cluster containining protein
MISQAGDLAIDARRAISNYCYTECLAYCCRRGYLLLSEKEVSLMKDTDIKTLKTMPKDSETDDTRYIFNIGLKPQGCPNLVKYKCTIHKNPDRPKACKEYPIFLFEDSVIVTDECPAVKENKLYPFLARFKKMGYKIVYSSDKR